MFTKTVHANLSKFYNYLDEFFVFRSIEKSFSKMYPPSYYKHLIKIFFGAK